jgi:vitamin B12 transporter
MYKTMHCHLAIWMVFFLTRPLHSQTAQYQYQKPVEISATRLKLPLVSGARECAVIGQAEIATMPASSLGDVLRLTGGVDLRPRGAAGVQSDFNLRGCSFEQVLVLVDGIRINDPQTGHHNSDIPVSLGDIDRIEILQGPASALYGSDGFGGVLHIVTKSGRTKDCAVRIQAGSFGTYSGSIHRSFRKNRWSGRFSAERKTSAGYREDTDYDIVEFSHRSSLEFGNKTLDASLGWTGKNFGANGFYSPFLSRENTKALLTSLNLGWQIRPAVSLHAQAFARRHDDRFVVDQKRPNWKCFTHRSWISGVEMHLNRQFGGDREVVLGFESENLELKSSNMGNRSQNRFAVFGEAALPLSESTVLGSGLRLDAQAPWGWEFSPSLGLVCAISDAFKWRASVGSAFRAPNFTELFYVSSTDTSNPNLKPEHGLCFESGLSTSGRNGTVEITLFHRTERDRIDRIAFQKGQPWQAVNIGKTDITGVSLSANGELTDRLALRFSYTGLVREEHTASYLSKYGLYSLRHLLSSAAFIKWSADWDQGVFFTFKEREQFGRAFFLDIRLSRRIGPYRIALELDNLMDSRFEDIPGVPCPGRSFLISMEWRTAETQKSSGVSSQRL